jgi:hypothetical protein
MGERVDIYGPVDVELKVHITDGKQRGVATIGMGHGQYPTPEALRQRVAEFARDEIPEGFRLMTKREFWDVLFPPYYADDEDGGLTPQRFAMPGSEDFE